MRDRRAFLGAVASAVIAAPLPTFAQQPSPSLRRIGFLSSESASNEGDRLDALRAGLRELGYVEGKSIVLEVRWAEGQYDRLPMLANGLVGLNVAVIVTAGAKAFRAVAAATTATPVVMVRASQPIGQGAIANLARPGGNITGWTGYGSELAAKRLELLKEVAPRIARVAFLVNAADPPSAIEAMEPVAKALKLDVPIFETRGPGDFERTFAAMRQRQVDAIVVQGDTMFNVNAKAVAELTTRSRLPSAGNLDFVEGGGMIGTGADMHEGFRRAATYVDKILKGAKPGDLPFEQATTFRTVINLKTAKAIGITIPQSLVLRADDVIQ